MKFNIIIPHYNSIDSCIRLLESIYSKIDKKNINIIVVDDRSTIDLFNLKKYLNQKNNKLYVNTHAKGAGGARNTGLDNLKSEYEFTLFADSDDYFLNNWYNQINNTIQINPDCDIYYFENNGDLVHPRNRKIEVAMDKELGSKEYLDLIIRDLVPWGKVFRTSFLLNSDIWFDETLKWNDQNFITQCATKTKNVMLSKDKIYFYSLSSSGITKTFSNEVWEDMKKVTYHRGDIVNEYLKKNNFKYRNFTTILLYQGIRSKVGIWELFTTLIDARKHHLSVFPNIIQLLEELIGRKIS